MFRKLSIFLLLRGNIGKPGAGACPVRGHSNVPRGSYDGNNGKTRHSVFKRTGAGVPIFNRQTQPGYDAVNSIKAMHAGKAKVFYRPRWEFFVGYPGYGLLRPKHCPRCRLTAHISTNLNRAHLVTGNEALILPSLGRTGPRCTK